MMETEPLSIRSRRLAFATLILLWAASVPVVILFADGWRYKGGFGLVQTGGIYVWTPYTDAEISLDGKSVGSSSFLDRGIYLSNLAPSSYTVTVEKDGYRPWKRVVVVEAKVVTDAEAVLVRTDVLLTKLSATAAATSSAYASPDTLDAYRAVFDTRPVASSTIPVGVSKAISLYIEQGMLFARWNGTGLAPSVLCGRPSYCVDEIKINDSGFVTRAMFYREGVVYRTAGGQVVFTEVDVRPDPIRIQLYSKPGADVALIDGQLIVKDGSAFHRIEEF